MPTERIHRLSVAQYRGMLEAGILKSGDPVELLEGWLVEKMTKNPPHVIAQGLLEAAMHRMVPAGWHVKIECPLNLGRLYAPHPGLPGGVRRSGARGDGGGCGPGCRSVPWPSWTS